MATPWSTLATTLWPLSGTEGLYSRIDRDTVRYLTKAVSGPDIDVKANAAIARMSNFYRQSLLVRFNNVYTDTVKEMSLQYTRRIEAAREFGNYQRAVAGSGEAVPQYAFSFGNVSAWGSSVFVPTDGVYGYTASLYPRLFFFSSSTTTINSSLLAGQAKPGEYAGDTFTEMLYINQGTLAVPTWNRADNLTLIDYINNPEELVECGYQRAISYIRSYATDVDSGEIEWRYANMPKAAKDKLSEASEQECLAFSLLEVDRSANGLISDYDRTVAQKRKVFFFG